MSYIYIVWHKATLNIKEKIEKVKEKGGVKMRDRKMQEKRNRLIKRDFSYYRGKGEKSKVIKRRLAEKYFLSESTIHDIIYRKKQERGKNE